MRPNEIAAREKAKKFDVPIGEIVPAKTNKGVYFKVSIPEMRYVVGQSHEKRIAQDNAGFIFHEMFLSSIVYADYYIVFVPNEDKKEIKKWLRDKVHSCLKPKRMINTWFLQKI